MNELSEFVKQEKEKELARKRAAKLDPHNRMQTLAVDLDGTITELPTFFNFLCDSWPGLVVVITYRKDRERAIADLAEHEIYYDELILVNSLEEKVKVIEERGVSFYIDDQDECLNGIPEKVGVLKVRNGGNYDFNSRQWLYDHKTGKKI